MRLAEPVAPASWQSRNGENSVYFLLHLFSEKQEPLFVRPALADEGSKVVEVSAE